MDNFILDQGMDILEGRFRVIKRLGNGAFGIVRPCRKLRGLDSDIGVSSKFSRT